MLRRLFEIIGVIAAIIAVHKLYESVCEDGLYILFGDEAEEAIREYERSQKRKR